MLKEYLNPTLEPQLIQRYAQFRIRRLLQIASFTLAGLVVATFISHGITQVIFATGCLTLLGATAFAVKQRPLAAAYMLLWSMAIMLSVLSYTGAGMLDYALLGYPGLLMYAAILGSIGLFYLLLLFVLSSCAVLTWLTLSGHLVPHPQILSWYDLVFVFIIFIVTAVSVYLMVKDMRQLMQSLQTENAKVKRSRAQIERQAHHDLLTNLPNRVYGERLFQQQLQFCRSQRMELAVLFLDLDNFKPVNDALGHSAGDLLLTQLADRLRSALTDNQYVIRFGGDEFLFLIPCAHQHKELGQLASAIIAETIKPFEIMQTQIEVSGSLGIALAPDDGDDFGTLCRKADLAMYKAKEDGRNTYRFYDNTLDQANVDKFNLLQRMRLALKAQQFVLYYQPKVSLNTQQVTAIEALLRWPQQDGSYISPADFIPLAESSGVINELGAWVIYEACRACARLRQQGFSQLTVAVNLSYVQFKNAKLLALVTDALHQANLPASALEFELTESLLIGDNDFIKSQLNALSRLGVTFAIDDFGTGYSNLGYLRSFNATVLKIDRSFIATLCQSERDEPLVKAMVQIASSLGLKTVAEGIENAETAQRLQMLGCDEGQGYYWAPALPEPRLVDYLRQQQQ